MAEQVIHMIAGLYFVGLLVLAAAGLRGVSLTLPRSLSRRLAQPVRAQHGTGLRPRA